MKFADFHNTKLAEASKTRNPTRDYLRNNPVSPDQMAKPVKQMSVPDLATVSDEALDNAYHYGRSTPGNTFGWQANLKSAAYAKQMIDKGVTDIEQISDAIHKGWNVTARAFVQNPDQFDDTEKLKAAGKLEAKLQQRAKLMNIEYAQLPDDEQEKDRVVARALLQAIKGQQGVAEASNTMQRYGQLILKRAKAKREAEAREKAEKEKAEQEKANKEKKPGVAEGAPISGDGGAVDNFRQQMANRTELAYQKGMAEGVLTEAEVKDQAVKILKGLAWGAAKGAKGLWWAVKNPAQAVVAAAAITHPKGTWNAANFGWNMVSDPAGTIGTLAKYGASSVLPWGDTTKAAADINRLLGNSATSNAIFDLANLAVQYSLPIAGVVALLYGGKKWMDWLKQNDAAEPGKKAFDRIANEPGNTQPAPQAQAQLQAPQKLDMAEGYWADAVKAIEKASKERAGKPFEKNPASHDKNGVYLGDKDLAGNPVPTHKEPEVAEAKADPLGAWIAHKNGTEARKFKTREGAKKYVASHEGFTVSSSEAFHDTYRKKKVQEVKKFRTTYGWAGGSKEPRSAHAKQVAAKRKEYEKGLGKFEPTDNMVGTAKIIKDIAMSDASPEHKKAAIDALNKKGVAEEYNPEYDDEAGMADNNLSTLRRAVDGLDDLIDTGDNLPEWCQEKIAVAKSMLVTVWDYMESEDDVMAERVEGGGHLKNKDDLRAKRKAIQDILMDPTMDADTLKRAQQAKLDLENQAEKIGVAEAKRWIQKAVNPKAKGDLHNALHVPQDETIPKSRIAQAIHSADPHLRHMAQFAKKVAKEDAGGMGTGSVATSMGAGNGFANGGPGITRRRK